MEVGYSYLKEQFNNPDLILSDIRKLVKSGDFTLGRELEKFEENFSAVIQTKYGVGVGSGTDALRLSLIALGVGSGDEIITAANSFYATAGAIATVGARPVFVDVDDNYTLNAGLIEAAITGETKAIIPVHLNGCPADMEKIMLLSKKHAIPVVEDACQAIGAEVNGKKVGSFGVTGCFSFHPLKPINVWGDGGMVVTSSEKMRGKLLLLRNHGLISRDECEFYAYNSRLDTLHAVVGNHLIRHVDWIINAKIENAKLYDDEFSKIPDITIPPRRKGYKNVFHNYVIMVKNRDKLLKFLMEQGIDAKVHYPIPLHLQKASEYLGYVKGDFPATEYQADHIISLPVHQHLTGEQKEYVIQKVKEFFR
ncbi:DegT/DnrJ/EryC1/StrS family aminotransferase [Candidatus Woesearchaeota archaeon]|nr:DegT/DnrJ/EryC1/StrS family aminotransferase [Candidatus Woesearchaeota archaeon]